MITATCESCFASPVPLTARMDASPDRLVCGACHADPRTATTGLGEPLPREESRQAILRDLAPAVHDENTAAMAASIADEFSRLGITGIEFADDLQPGEYRQAE